MMSIIGQTSALLGYSGILVVAIGFLVGAWRLICGKEWCQKQWKFVKMAAMMPGPPALPLIGNALHFACKGDELLNRIVELGQPYEVPFRFWMGTKLFVIMRNPRDMEVIFNSSIATHKPYEYRFLGSYLGHGLVTDSGPTHRALRKLIMPMVNGKALNAYLKCFDRQSRRCVECLKDRVDTGEFDIMHFMDNCTLDIILETIMGTAGTAQNNGYEGVIDCSTRAIGLAHERMMKAWLYPNWIYARSIPGQKFASAMSVLHKFAETFVAEKKKQYYGLEGCSDFPARPIMAVLDKLTIHNAKTNMMDDKRLRDGIANIWIPDKVRAEVEEVVGDEDVTTEKISQLKYLDMVFKETVRLFPVGPVILRELQDDLDFETCTAPKGCTIALFVYMTHRDPKHWTEPEKFDPDRFTPENSVGRHRYAFVPFSGGIRGCIGQQYATMVVKTLVARVIQKYRISSKGSLDTLRLKAGISVRSIDGYNISITRIELHKTGGGSFTPQSTETDFKIQELLKDQFEPDMNPFDDSAILYKNDAIDLDNTEPENSRHPDDLQSTEDFYLPIIYEDESSAEPVVPVPMIPPPSIVINTPRTPFARVPSSSTISSAKPQSSPIPSTSSITCSQAPAARPSASWPKKQTSASKPKRNAVLNIAETLIHRKKMKNSFDQASQNEKTKILGDKAQLLDTGKEIKKIDLKLKELDVKNQEILLEKKLEILNTETQIKLVELEIKKIERNTKELEYKIKLKEYESFTVK